MHDFQSKDGKYIKGVKKIMQYLQGLDVEADDRDAEVKKVSKMDNTAFRGLATTLGF